MEKSQSVSLALYEASNSKSLPSSFGPYTKILIAAIRGARQGLYYGGKVRMTHSIVMQYLFGRGTIMEKLKTSIKLSWIHGRNLGSFVFIYKLIQGLLT